MILTILTTSKPNFNLNHIQHTTIVTIASDFFSSFQNYYGFLRNRVGTAFHSARVSRSARTVARVRFKAGALKRTPLNEPRLGTLLRINKLVLNKLTPLVQANFPQEILQIYHYQKVARKSNFEVKFGKFNHMIFKLTTIR